MTPPPRIDLKDRSSNGVSRVAMVTGVGGAMGAAIARALLAEGHKVVLADSDGPALEAVRAALGEGTFPIQFDLSDPAQIKEACTNVRERVGPVDGVIGNGDYSCDSAFIGVSDDAACQSAEECLAKLRAKFGGTFRATIGDHELGKFSLLGARGGMRLASYHRTCNELALEPFWPSPNGSSSSSVSVR